MERKTEAEGSGEILDAADKLSLEEQEALIDLLSRHKVTIISRGHFRLLLPGVPGIQP